MDTRFKKGQHHSPSTEFKKGMTPHNKGVGWHKCKMCENLVRRKKIYCSVDCTWKDSEYRKKISDAKKKNPINYWSGKKRESMTGKNNWNWKGGIDKIERNRSTHEAEYRQWRDAVFYRDNYTCQICGQYSGHLHADHMKSWAEHPQLRYLISNGRTLCRACHYYITFKRKMPLGSKWGLTRRVG